MMCKALVVCVLVFLLFGDGQCMNPNNRKSGRRRQQTQRRQNSQASSSQQNQAQQSSSQQTQPQQRSSQQTQPQQRSSQQTSQRDKDFINNALNTLQEVGAMFQIHSCIDAAREKARSLGYTNGAYHFSISWISMYSRLCNIDESLLPEDKDLINFPFRLNKELRCMYHQGRNRQVQNMFQRVANMIDQSLSMMRPKVFRNVYRGCTFNAYAGQGLFVDEGYCSSSLSEETALWFAKGKTFMIAEEMYGVCIANYAEDRFRRQKEVLGFSRSVFVVNRVITDSAAIDNMFPNLKSYLQKPTELIYVSQIRNVNVNQVNAVLNTQRQNSLSYCDPTQ